MKEINLGDYRSDVELLIKYIPWFESKKGTNVSSQYSGDGLSKSTFTFPVYETMLLNFINDVQKTALIDANYAYAYSGNNIYTVEDEFKVIEEAALKNANVLCSILSKYVLGGMTKGTVWSTGVENGIFLAVLKKMKLLLDIWDAPLA